MVAQPRSYWWYEPADAHRRSTAVIRKTVTLPEEVAAAVDELVARGAAPSVSAFVQEALSHHVARVQSERMAAEAAHLDTEQEVALARGELPPPRWRRLR